MNIYLEKKITNTVSLSKVNALGCGHIAIFFMRNGLWILATPFIQMTLGVDPFLLSLSIIVPLFIALFLGPVVGELSDTMYKVKGTRTPLLAISSVVCGIAYGCMWMVPADWPHNYILIYVFCLALIYQLFASVYIIPLTSVMYEVSENSYQRTRTLAMVAYYNKVCSVLYHWAFPIAQLSFFGSIFIGIKVVGWFIGLIFIILFGLVPVFAIKSDNVKPQIAPKSKETRSNQYFNLSNIKASISCVVSNKNFALLMMIVFCQSCISGYAASMDYYLIVYYMFEGDVTVGSFWKGVLSSSYSIMGFLIIPVLTYLTRKRGAKQTLKLVFLFTMLGAVLKWFIFVPGNHWLLPFDAVFSGSIWLSMFVLLPSLIADLSEEDKKNTNHDRKGSFISIHTLGVKLSSALAVILSGYTLNIIGFDAAILGQQSDTTLMYMRIILTFGTLLSSVLGYFIIRKVKTSS